jgi:hypothetical protein
VAHSSDQIDVRAVYKTLHRLERRHFFVSDWRPTGRQARHAKYYRLTRKGWRGISERESTVSDTALLATAIALAIVNAFDGAASDATPRRRLAVVVDSPDRAMVFELGRGRPEVFRILGAVGVDVDWSITDLTSQTRGRPNAMNACFVVHVVVVSAEHGRASAEPLGATPWTDPRGAEILIFYENVSEFAQIHQVPSSLVFGLVNCGPNRRRAGRGCRPTHGPG